MASVARGDPSAIWFEFAARLDTTSMPLATKLSKNRFATSTTTAASNGPFRRVGDGSFLPPLMAFVRKLNGSRSRSRSDSNSSLSSFLSHMRWIKLNTCSFVQFFNASGNPSVNKIAAKRRKKNRLTVSKIQFQKTATKFQERNRTHAKYLRPISNPFNRHRAVWLLETIPAAI